MADLTTEYMGLTLKNPIIAGSSGITESADGVKKCEDAGAGAVVMKSVFEEQINAEINSLKNSSTESHPEWEDYLQYYGKEQSLQPYLDEIQKAKESVSVPVIGSVNCISSGGWSDFVTRIAETGVDGLEVNVFVLPYDFHASSEEIEKIYLEIYQSVKSLVSIPIALKIPPFITSPGHFIKELNDVGVKTFVLFNRSLPFDIDIEKESIKVGSIVSSPTEMSYSLRTISKIAGNIPCQLSATTGVHDAESVVKHLFAGADTVQVCSALYKNDVSYIGKLLTDVNAWMDSHGIKSINDIRGKLSQKNSETPAAYERAQYVKVFANIS